MTKLSYKYKRKKIEKEETKLERKKMKRKIK